MLSAVTGKQLGFPAKVVEVTAVRVGEIEVTATALATVLPSGMIAPRVP